MNEELRRVTGLPPRGVNYPHVNCRCAKSTGGTSQYAQGMRANTVVSWESLEGVIGDKSVHAIREGTSNAD